MDKHICKISVHEFVDWILEGGDLVFGMPSAKRMQEGIDTHVAFQEKSDAKSEVAISYTQLSDLAALHISGRMDLLHETEDRIIIEELKSTYKKPEDIKEAALAHTLQAKCYAAMYCSLNDIDEIETWVTYVHVRTQESCVIAETYKAKELISWLRSKCDEILYDAELDIEHKNKRNSAAQNLQFPFPDFREGQRNMSGYVYLTERDSTLSFLCAPTGIGKTMGALYPSIKSLGEGMGDKIFYLTAKNTIKEVAAKTMKTLFDSGFYGRSVLLTAKTKMCPYEHQTCHPMYCEQARGYYDRLPAALEDMMQSGHYGVEDILKIAGRHNICPFELSLDFSLKCDVIICDYNHAFDPVAHLKRFFDDGGDYLLLIDEAHNLVSRARDMFSVSISKKEVLALRRLLPKKLDKNEKNIKASLTKLNKILLEYRKAMDYDGIEAQSFFDPPNDITTAVIEFLDAAEPLMDVTIRKSYSNELFELYFGLKGYKAVARDFSEYYKCFALKHGSELEVKIFCIDPSHKLQDTYDKIRSAVLFSASITPFSYFARLLSARDSERYLLPSPFPPENLKVIVNSSISTKYADRMKTADEVCKNIYEFIISLGGRHMVFFPSYKYMEMIHELFTYKYGKIDVIAQSRSMSEEDRAEFLMQFEHERENPLAAFAVMGGVFSEGIDLVGERLIGAVVVGIGLPQICYERDMIKQYHFDNEEPGFAYAYAYPGFNKIIQAVGRIIRTKDDKGVALLIGNRFMHDIYRELMPTWWHPLSVIRNSDEIKQILSE